MSDPKILVVYYSRTGATKKVGEVLARELQCDEEELTDTRSRHGALGVMRSIFDALLNRTTRLAQTSKDPGDYDLVVIGTPVWANNVSTPIRTYLGLYKERFKKLAYFATYSGGMSPDGALKAMRALAGPPVGQLAIEEQRVQRGQHVPDIARFAQDLTAAIPGVPPEQPPLHRVGPPPAELSDELRR
ncbi:MAG: flavodoxin family protein [Myxococcaceae bacterium]